MAQIVPRDSISERLGSGLGQGISSGVTAILNQKISDMQARQTQQRSYQNLSSSGFTPQEAQFISNYPPEVQYKIINSLWQRGGQEQPANNAEQNLQGLGQSPNINPQQPPNALTALGENIQPTPQQNPLQSQGQNPVAPIQKPPSIADTLRKPPPLSPETKAKLDQAERHFTTKQLTPVVKQLETEGKAAQNTYITAKKINDVLKRGNVNLADVIQNRFEPKEWYNEDTQRVVKLINDLIINKASLGKGIPTKARLELEKLSKADISMKPKAFQEAITDILGAPNLLKEAARGFATEELEKQWEGNYPKSAKSDIYKLADKIVKEHDFVTKRFPEAIGEGTDIADVNDKSQIAIGTPVYDESTNEQFFWDGTKPVPAAEFQKGK